jgi:hypothetical protein
VKAVGTGRSAGLLFQFVAENKNEDVSEETCEICGDLQEGLAPGGAQLAPRALQLCHVSEPAQKGRVWSLGL